jgi:hypothetical protein
LIGWEKKYIEFVSKETVDTAIKEYMQTYDDRVYKAVVQETEDGGFTIGYFPEDDKK